MTFTDLALADTKFRFVRRVNADKRLGVLRYITIQIAQIAFAILSFGFFQRRFGQRGINSRPGGVL